MDYFLEISLLHQTAVSHNLRKKFKINYVKAKRGLTSKMTLFRTTLKLEHKKYLHIIQGCEALHVQTQNLELVFKLLFGMLDSVKIFIIRLLVNI